ncbi:MAG TPA: hypothetical protein VN660_13050 [Steroidobacteraceae bacterium]|nr:hypothetical protein [Steroidobacteraceae bacterium]
MKAKALLIFPVAIAAIGCSTVGQITVKSYTAKSGQQIVAGQAAPKAAYQCSHVSEDSLPWGLKGNMDRVHATERVTAAAVDEAPSKGANYVYVMVPGEARIGNFNVNAFKDARVAFYSCAQLPAAAS